VTRIRARELRGRGWLNTTGKALSIQGFRDKIVLLDFWTSSMEPSAHFGGAG